MRDLSLLMGLTIPGGVRATDTVSEVILTNGTCEVLIRPSLTGFVITSSLPLEATDAELPEDDALSWAVTNKLHVENASYEGKQKTGQALIIPCDPAEETRAIDFPVSLDAAQAAVATGTTRSLVQFITFARDKQLLVHEEGLLHNLPLNERASALCGQAIVGDALLLEGDAQWK